jgi:hypothetical protein
VNAPGNVGREHARHVSAPASILYPLSEFYERSGVPLPHVERLAPSAVPEPYRRLLVHERDMTPTLEAEYGLPVGLRVLERAVAGGVASRRVVLILGAETAVEMGAIRIFLDRLPPPARQAVLEWREPFGSLLRRNRLAHYSRPSAYFQVTADASIAAALGIQSARALYGRRNTIWNGVDEPLAEVVEILPPSINQSGERR